MRRPVPSLGELTHAADGGRACVVYDPGTTATCCHASLLVVRGGGPSHRRERTGLCASRLVRVSSCGRPRTVRVCSGTLASICEYSEWYSAVPRWVRRAKTNSATSARSQATRFSTSRCTAKGATPSTTASSMRIRKVRLTNGKRALDRIPELSPAVCLFASLHKPGRVGCRYRPVPRVLHGVCGA